MRRVRLQGEVRMDLAGKVTAEYSIKVAQAFTKCTTVHVNKEGGWFLGCLENLNEASVSAVRGRQ